jgi:Icc-related predicted phosphoesterase
MAQRRSTRVNRVLCAADPRGSAEGLAGLKEAAASHDVQAVAVAGDLGGGADRAAGYRALFRALGEIGLPAFWVPGEGDAPIADYLREAHNMELVFEMLRGVHGTAAMAPDGHVLVAGVGGHVDDDPEAPREEQARLSYPRWEAEYRLKVLRELDEHQVMLLFATPPSRHGVGSEVLAELVGTYRPRLVVCAGEAGTGVIGRSPIVAPGSLADGSWAIADLHTHAVEWASAARV